MATITPRQTQKGDTRYKVQIRMKGLPPVIKSFPRLDDAKRWAAKTETEIREGEYFGKAEASRHTFGEMIDRFVERELPKRRKGTGKLNYMLGWWREQAGGRTLDRVDRVLIASLRDKATTETTFRGTLRSPATANRYLGALSVAFSAAREWGWVEDNPVRRVKKFRESRGRVRFLSDTERVHLLKAAQASRDDRLHPLVVLAISTGARQGELMRLRWRDLDWERGAAVLEETKNGERRSLPITGLAARLLRERRRQRGFQTDLIFAKRNGKAGFPESAWRWSVAAGTKSLQAEAEAAAESARDALRRAKREGSSPQAAADAERALDRLEQARESVGLDGFRFHDLRHTAASYLAMNGATLAEIAEVLGHKTLAMVKRYSHLTEQHTSSVVAKMNAAVFGE